MTLPLKWTGSAQEITAICSLMTRCSGNRYTIRFFLCGFQRTFDHHWLFTFGGGAKSENPRHEIFPDGLLSASRTVRGRRLHFVVDAAYSRNRLVNVALSWIGIEGPAWLTDPAWTKPAIILMKLWAVGGGMLLYLASLQGVPEQLYEAAEIDGASVLRRFWHITVPMITPVLFFELVTHIIGGFQIFQEAMSCRRT